MSYIGQTGMARIDHKNMLNLQQAKQMLSEGCAPSTIKIQTGWELGIDGLWRYEILDPFLPNSEIEAYVKPRFGESINIRLILQDNLILDAYPQFENLTLYAMYSPQKGVAGYYNPSTNGMVISMGRPSDKFEYQIEGVLLHEIQHLIQYIEGFAQGGNPKAIGMRRYLRLAGEVEARNICLRHFLTDDERRRTLRTETQDIEDKDQIIIC